MNSQLLSRSLGLLGPPSFQQSECNRLLHSLNTAPQVKFDGKTSAAAGGVKNAGRVWAHPTGVNSVTIDSLLSGGADASIHLWDLDETVPSAGTAEVVYRPAGSIPRSTSSHQYGITSLTFYPFDPYAFLSSSYDHTLRVYDTNTLSSVATFTLPSPIYSHALSSTASHLLVAVATAHPAIRLVDLRSGASAHSLPGHDGAVLSVAWSPLHDHILASAGADGYVRMWDIRRAGRALGVLDLDDNVGVLGSSERREGRAHVGPCNGVTWTDDGAFIVTCGHDERIRVWDAATGANTLVHFGPTVRNRVLAPVLPTIVPSGVTGLMGQVLLFPSESDVLMMDLLEGTLFKRLRAVARVHGRASKAGRVTKERVTSLAWRAGHCELYSGHMGGEVRAWLPASIEDGMESSDNEREAGKSDEEGAEGDRKRRRLELDQMYRDLTKQKITFT